MVLTRSQYKKLGEILVSWEETKRSRGKKMTGSNEAENKRLEVVEEQVASISSTLQDLVKFVKEKKVKPLVKDEEDEEKDSKGEEDDTTKTS